MLYVPSWHLTKIPLNWRIRQSLQIATVRLMSSINMMPGPEGSIPEKSAKKRKFFTPKFITQLPQLNPGQHGGSVLDFPFNETRVRVISQRTEVHDGKGGVVYWMSRDQRVQDNWALLYAQKLAIQKQVPLHVCFCLVPTFLDATIRYFSFLLKGLEEVEKECTNLGIPFHLLVGHAKEKLPDLIQRLQLGAVVTDFSPLRMSVEWLDGVNRVIPQDVPIFQVDAHNIVPVWVASAEQERSASSIRKKIHAKLPGYCTEFPAVVTHPYQADQRSEPVDWVSAEASLQVDRTVGAVKWATPGTRAGLAMLDEFINSRLHSYTEFRNNPTHNAQSNLSPWIHFGQLSAQRVMLALNAHRGSLKESVEWISEQLFVRRELSDNFCFHNQNYDSVSGTPAWAQETLLEHAMDQREYVYSREQLENSQTHDALWNACQRQLVLEGKMHGYLRMFWAKKILEWTSSAETALADCIYLNDRYSLDGRDPNGYSCIMWSICGLHDREFPERPVYGKIRYMGYTGFMNDFDIPTYIRRYFPETKDTAHSQKPDECDQSKTEKS